MSFATNQPGEHRRTIKNELRVSRDRAGASRYWETSGYVYICLGCILDVERTVYRLHKLWDTRNSETITDSSTKEARCYHRSKQNINKDLVPANAICSPRALRGPVRIHWGR